jgi:hypothetical protein
MINLKDTVGSRKQIQSQFIQFAIENNLVDAQTHEYKIEKNPVLYSAFKERKVAPKQIFKFIRSHFLQ